MALARCAAESTQFKCTISNTATATTKRELKKKNLKKVSTKFTLCAIMKSRHYFTDAWKSACVSEWETRKRRKEEVCTRMKRSAQQTLLTSTLFLRYLLSYLALYYFYYSLNLLICFSLFSLVHFFCVLFLFCPQHFALFNGSPDANIHGTASRIRAHNGRWK